MPNGEQLLIDTHGMVQKMSGKMEAIEEDLKEGKDARKRIHERQDKAEKEFVNKAECADHRAAERLAAPERSRSQILKQRAIEAGIIGTLVGGAVAIAKAVWG